MKTLRLQRRSVMAYCMAVGMATVLDVHLYAGAVSNTFPKARFDDLIASTGATNLESFESTAGSLSTDQQQVVSQLLAILRDARSPNSARSYAAYYLGEVRALRSASGDRAVDGLAAAIALTYGEADQEHILHLHVITRYPAFQALVDIGCPSIPAVIRNLGDSDDALVRELSLKVLYRVEGDKEIARVRLQHAVDAQKDPKKQTRLQSALKSLSEMQLGN